MKCQTLASGAGMTADSTTKVEVGIAVDMTAVLLWVAVERSVSTISRCGSCNYLARARCLSVPKKEL